MTDALAMALERADLAAFAQLNAGPGLDGLPLAAALFSAVWLIFLVPAGLVGLWFSGQHARRVAAIEALVATACALALNKAIGTLWYHARPFAAGVGNTFLAHAPTSSFPSNHGTIMLTAALVLATCGTPAVRRLGLFLLPVAAIVAWSRVFVGVHWPLDMVGALLVAAAMCVLVRTAPARRGTALLALSLYGLLPRARPR